MANPLAIAARAGGIMVALTQRRGWKRRAGLAPAEDGAHAPIPPVGLLERVSDALFSLDRAWRFRYLNPAAERLFGLGRDELLGQIVWDRFPDIVGSAFEQHYRRAVAERIPVTFEACHPPAAIWVEVRAYPTTDGLEVHARDITPDKRAADALRRWVQGDEVRFRALVEHAADIVGLLNADGTIRYVNRAIEQVLGYAPNEWIGRSASAIVHPDDRSRFRHLFDEDVQRHGVASLAEFRLRHTDGSWRSIEMIANNLLGEPRIAGLVVTARDITERQRAAGELAAARRQLAASQESERLRLARELHDGPVQDLLAISYQLAERRADRGDAATRTPDSDARLDAERQRVLAVVGQLRGVIGALRPPGLAEFGLPAALRGHVTRLVRDMGEDRPDIVLEVDEQTAGLPEALAVTIFRIVQEALRNSLRHAQARQITVRLRTESASVRLAIRDDGRGFRVPDRLDELAQAGHFGLVGLAERVEQANGEISVTSSPDAGTTIAVRFPIAEEEDGDEQADPGGAGR